MTYDLYQVDAFTNEVFRGNQAAVMPLMRWLDDDVMLAIAQENNVAETAFVIPKGEGKYDLRWFTPGREVKLCGHATLATAHILYTELQEKADKITFDTLSGPLRVTRMDDLYEMEFPAYNQPIDANALRPDIEAAAGSIPRQILSDAFLMAVFEDAQTVREMTVDQAKIMALPHHGHKGCLLVTAPGDQGYDFISRFFAIGVGIPEDPVTGAAHCMLAPYWAVSLGKNSLKAFQASPRGGQVQCTVKEDRVILRGHAVTYLRGQITF
ncbi:MAG: PhzF family phenazine biosynthesis protein [bacterium]